MKLNEIRVLEAEHADSEFGPEQSARAKQWSL